MKAIAKNFSKIIIVLGIVVGVTCLVMSLNFFVDATGNSKKSVQVVFLGDSIFGNFRDESSIPNLFSARTGKSVLNAGLGGTTAAVCQDNPRSEVVQDSLSLVGIVEAIVSENFSVQHSAIPSRVANGELTYFEDTISDLESTNMSGAEIIIIEQGLNDYFSDWPIDGTKGKLNSYVGALDYSIGLIKEKCPDSIIILASPVYGKDNLARYSSAAAIVAKVQGVYFFDAYNAGIVDSSNVDEMTIDGIHLNEKGREIYANALYEYCIENGLID